MIFIIISQLVFLSQKLLILMFWIRFIFSYITEWNLCTSKNKKAIALPKLRWSKSDWNYPVMGQYYSLVNFFCRRHYKNIWKGLVNIAPLRVVFANSWFFYAKFSLQCKKIEYRNYKKYWCHWIGGSNLLFSNQISWVLHSFTIRSIT